MTKSEVLKKMIEIMAYNTGNYSDAEERAPEVLKYLEEIGMRPPDTSMCDCEDCGGPSYNWSCE